MHERLRGLEEFLILPEATPGSDPSWFGFPIAVRETAPFSRDELVIRLNQARVGTRLLFGGNLTRQPAYAGREFRTPVPLTRSDFVTRQVFWIGVYPGIQSEMLDYVSDIVHEFCDDAAVPATAPTHIEPS